VSASKKNSQNLCVLRQLLEKNYNMQWWARAQTRHSLSGKERYKWVSSEMDRVEICIICISWWVFLWLGDASVMSRSSSKWGRLLAGERSFDLNNFLPYPFRRIFSFIALAHHWQHVCSEKTWQRNVGKETIQEECTCMKNPQSLTFLHKQVTAKFISSRMIIFIRALQRCARKLCFSKKNRREGCERFRQVTGSFIFQEASRKIWSRSPL